MVRYSFLCERLVHTSTGREWSWVVVYSLLNVGDSVDMDALVYSTELDVGDITYAGMSDHC